MTPTIYRDQVAELAKTNVTKASETATKIKDPWFQAQAWAHLARRSDQTLHFARRAVKSASQCKDDYQRSAVRAWEIAALAERKFWVQAHNSLDEALKIVETAEPIGSKAESLLLLFQAALKISKEDAVRVAGILQSLSFSTHWRVQRAWKTAREILEGRLLPREFFW
jgi:hypothetical protein